MIRFVLLLLLLLPGCAGSKRSAAEAVRCLTSHPDAAEWKADPRAALAQVKKSRELIASAIRSARTGSYDPTPQEAAALRRARALLAFVVNCVSR